MLCALYFIVDKTKALLLSFNSPGKSTLLRVFGDPQSWVTPLLGGTGNVPILVASPLSSSATNYISKLAVGPLNSELFFWNNFYGQLMTSDDLIYYNSTYPISMWTFSAPPRTTMVSQTDIYLYRDG